MATIEAAKTVHDYRAFHTIKSDRLLVLLKGATVLGVLWGAWIAHEPAAYQAQLAALTALFEAGRIRPRISARFPLEQAADAIRTVGERRALGKVVVTVGGHET